MATLGLNSNNLMSLSNSMYQDALSSMRKASIASSSAVSNAQDTQKKVTSAANDAYGLISKSVGTAETMSPYITNVAKAASDVKSTAGGLTQYEAMLKDYSQKLAANADPLVNYGNGLISDSVGLRNYILNGGSAGSGAYYQNLAAYSPDRYVAQAAADAQSSADNAYSQMLRNQSRSGQTASGSSNSASLNQEWARTTAALLAGAKTRAYQTGLNEQTTALRNALADALNMGNSGVSAVSAGNTALSSAASAASGAANVVSTKANLEATAGQLYASSAQLTAQQAGLYNSAASTKNQTASLELSAGQMVTNAFQSAVQASLNLASMQYSISNDAAQAARQQEYLDSLSSNSSNADKSSGNSQSSSNSPNSQQSSSTNTTSGRGGSSISVFSNGQTSADTWRAYQSGYKTPTVS